MYKNKDIYLDSVSRENLKVMFDWINDKDLVHFSNRYKPIDFESHSKWYQDIINSKNEFIFGIKLLHNDKFIGTCQLHSIDFINQKAKAQIRLGLESSKGYGTQALESLLQFGWLELNLRKICLSVFSDNIQAIKSYKKVGFMQEGIFKKHTYINGKYQDIIYMAIFKE